MSLMRQMLMDLVSRTLFRVLERGRYPATSFGHFGDGAGVLSDVFIDCPANVYLGSRALINRGCKVNCGSGEFRIGSNSHLSGDVYIGASCGIITLGDGVAVGPKVVLVSHSNAVDGLRPIIQSHFTADITIGDDVLIGAAAVILPGVHIGAHAVVGAGCVVNRDVPPYAIVVGVPARVIGHRDAA